MSRVCSPSDSAEAILRDCLPPYSKKENSCSLKTLNLYCQHFKLLLVIYQISLLRVTVIEVQSVSLQSSLYQLYYYLIDLMRYLSHFCDNLDEVYGYYLPTQAGFGVVMKLTYNLKYLVKLEPIKRKTDVCPKIRQLLHQFTQ